MIGTKISYKEVLINLAKFFVNLFFKEINMVASLDKINFDMLVKMAVLVMASAALAAVPAMSSAQTGAQPQQLEDVEALLDNVVRYDGKKVSVSGEVEEVIDEKAFILESGGLFEDEMVVLKPAGNLMVKEDYEVTVTGTVRAVALVDIEREYGWDLDPQIKIELENIEAFLIADSIEITEKDD
ncbi:hypothetical protein NOC27_2130 [Nitrosococcus oceani AFC27]|nr:hypothetical protein NOC27_2130 [Nitrosococcus oceani AFC27]